MKIIEKSNVLKVNAIENIETMQINDYAKDVWIAKEGNEYYLIQKRIFSNDYVKQTTIRLEDAICEVCNANEQIEDLKLNIEYGDKDALIIDMHGIDNFRFAKSLIFSDDTVRKILLRLGLLEKNKEYLRIGCSGARECSYHPGGEVYESQLINGKNAGGIAQSISGYLQEGEQYSKKISLYGEDRKSLREERIVYSHTAVLKKCKLTNSNSIYVKIKATKSGVSFLDILTKIANQLGLSAYAVQICIQTNNDDNDVTEIKGRVLRHMPTEPFKVLQDATDIGLEKIFKLDNDEIMYGVGSKYDRYEPEWTEFTGGRQYERRGHIHSMLMKEKKEIIKKHEVFHLRDVFISPASDIQVVFTPVNQCYKIYEIYNKEDKFYFKTTDKEINNIISNIKIIDNK